jgi:ribosome biogenesis GTPase
MYTATNRKDYPAVGDWVVITHRELHKVLIHGILPRKSILEKKYSNKQESQIIATNIDTAFITESVDRDYNLNRIERFLVLVREGNITPVIVLNKIDLISDDELQSKILDIQTRVAAAVVIATSIHSKKGLNILEQTIVRGKTYCFLGSSGVGKSSLINVLLGQEKIKTDNISERTSRGKHTTTAREMHFLNNGGILIDTPGTREVGITGSDTGIKTVFDEIDELSKACRFSDCSHTKEPGCAVLKAVGERVLDEIKYYNYLKLKKETDFYALTELEKRNKDKKFGKFIKKALQDFKS